jgi:ABC-type branched-subunit amino acid transport system substrate-binding protein
MRRPGIRFAAIPVVLALLATSCGKDRNNSSSSAPPVTTAAPTTTAAAPETTSAGSVTTDSTAASASTEATTAPTETTVPALPAFGDAPWPCGAGDGNNTDDGSTIGVTKDSIAIAGGDDAGYAGSPGLNSEMTDAMKAAVAACNDLGGINGRKITFNYFDAALFNVGPAIQGACDGKNFFLVGEGWAFDVNQEETRLACGLPAVPTYATSAAFAHGKDVFPPNPGPSDETSAGLFPQIAKLFPDKIDAVAALVGAFAATQESRDRAVAASTQFGWKWVSTTIEYNPVGEADWTPFVKQIQASGAKMIYWSGTCLPNLQLFAQAAKANGLDVPIVTDANHYAKVCADANTDGALNNLYLRTNTVPFEEADVNKATQDYLDLIAKAGGKTSLLGVQTISAFLLWATAASECGPNLTRECTLQNLKDTHEWTGHGLHAAADPGGNHPSPCNAVLHLVDDKYERVVPKERGTFECDPAWIAKISGTPALAAAKLDANRISQQFGTGG